MKKINLYSIILGVFLIFSPILYAQALIIDHRCTDLSKIPVEWINQAKSMFRIHYAHTSHGEQIIVGLERIYNSNTLYNYNSSFCSLPTDSNTLNILDGQPLPYCETYITPDLYWETTEGINRTQATIN
ncbi:MAG: hypothetical protein JRI44_09715, partial [Deltaproteobacteria bacterium]|nr:hypothetical protein [Deltaproteobacteria bacterium]